MTSGVEFRERTLRTADGLTLSFREYGSRFASGVPVLCLAGLTRSARDFHDIARAICDTRRVLCLDARGRGRSDYDPDFRNYNLIRETGDVISLVSTEFEGPFAVIGTSRGGLQAMILNGVRGAALVGIVLNDIGPAIEMAGLQRIVGYLGVTPDPLENWEDAVAALKATNADSFPTLTDSQWLAWAKRTFREEDGMPVLDYDPRLREAVLEGGGPADFWPQFRGLGEKPVLVLRGENSDLLSAETVQAMKRIKPDLRAMTVRDRGHVPFLDEREARQAIINFLAELDAAQQS